VLDTASIADANGLGTFALQWQASSDGQTWQNIAGETTTAYSPQDALFASFARGAAVQLRAVASFTDGAGNAESVASAATAAVQRSTMDRGGHHRRHANGRPDLERQLDG